MGKLTKSHMIETAVWLLIAIIFFGFTFEFNQPIEIYIFGATGWPRVVIGLMLIVTFGNFYHHLKYGSTIQAGRVGIADDDEAGSYNNLAAVIKVLAVLGTPFLFALSLKPVGFYFATPFFIALIIVIFGERRWKWILSITALIYGLLLGLFMVVLNAPLPQGNTSPFYDYSALILRLNNDLQQLW
tara:strand:- start:1110 stop:1667 length:558 start_codon:yes stop_codon:yes gene_type:complete